MKTRDYREHLDEVLQDPEATAAYLTATVEEEDQDSLALAIQDIFRARDKSISSEFYCQEIAAVFLLVRINLDRMGLQMRIEKK